MRAQNVFLLLTSVAFAALMGRRTVKTVGVYFEPKSFMKLKLVGDEFKKINLYENLTPNSEPIALLQQTETKKIFLEDPFRIAPDYLQYAQAEYQNQTDTNWGDEAVEFDWNRFFTINEYKKHEIYLHVYPTGAPFKILLPSTKFEGEFEKKLAILAAHKVDLDANITYQDLWRDAATPLEATLMRSINCVVYLEETLYVLLTRGANINVPGTNGEFPLHIAVEYNDPSVVEMLVDFGADVDVLDLDGCTPLMRAIEYDTRCIGILLNGGASIDGPAFRDIPESNCMNGDSPLHFAVRLNIPHVIEMLVEYGADVNMRNSRGSTPLIVAARYDHLECVESLLNRGASVDVPDIKGTFPLHAVIRRNHRTIWSDGPAIIQMLIDFGADVDARDGEGITPLIQAIYNDCTECIKILIKGGADVFSKSEHGGKTAFDLMDQKRKYVQYTLALGDVFIEIQRREDAYVKNWFLVALFLPFFYTFKVVLVLIFSIILLVFSPLTGYKRTLNYIIDAFSGMCSEFSHEISRIMKSKRPY